MSIKSDIWIERMAQEHGMIDPFETGQVREGVISYGLSSYGYDIRVADDFKIFTNVNTTVVDPKNFDPNSFVEFQGKICTIPPNSFALGRSVEYMRMPRNVTGLVLGKSTYARCGLVTNFTPLEAGWEGHITIEISNTTPLPARIYANEGIAQILFFEAAEPCRTSYADRADGKGGKYQGQMGIALPIVDSIGGLLQMTTIAPAHQVSTIGRYNRLVHFCECDNTEALQIFGSDCVGFVADGSIVVYECPVCFERQWCYAGEHEYNRYLRYLGRQTAPDQSVESQK